MRLEDEPRWLTWDQALGHLAVHEASDEDILAARHGKPLQAKSELPEGAWVRVQQGERMLAIAEHAGSVLRLRTVLLTGED